MANGFVVCLCADDYAMTPGVSRGILAALDAGALTATSAMTTSAWWPELAPAALAHRPRASIGLHLNLTLGAPLGPMPTLAPTGALPSIGALLARSRRRALPEGEITAEIERQLDRFADVAGHPPDHVDGHQHVQVLPGIRAPLLAALARRTWRPWLRDSGDRALRILRRGTTLKKALGVAMLARCFTTDAGRRGLVCNDGFAGFSDFAPQASYARAFTSYLKAPGQRHLVMCHPGEIDEALVGLDPVVETRPRELAFLLSPALPRCLAAVGARLGRFDG